MVAFSNPVIGSIAAKGAAHPPGTFVVTSTFADHVASGRAPGVDIGNGGCGAPVIAMKAGTIILVQPGKVGSTASIDASIVRILHADGTITGYAHLKIRVGLAVGQEVPEGFVLGAVDMIGATACHLHWGPKINGVEVDGWPLLKQNGATEGDEMVPIPPGKFLQLVNQKSATVSIANFRAERLLTAPVLKLYPLGTAFVPLMQADDGSPAGGPTPTRWFGGFELDDRGFAIYGWFHSSVLGPFSDTSPNCAAEVLKAVTPLEKRLKDINVISS